MRDLCRLKGKSKGRTDQRSHGLHQIRAIEFQIPDLLRFAIGDNLQLTIELDLRASPVHDQRLKARGHRKMKINDKGLGCEGAVLLALGRSAQQIRKSLDLDIGFHACGTDHDTFQVGDWVRDHADILNSLLMLIQHLVKGRSSPDPRIRADQIAHALLGFHPRSARLAPARPIKHADTHAQAISLFDGERNQLPPFRAQNCDITLRDAIADDMTDEDLTNASLLHRLNIRGNAFGRHIVIQPIPIHVRLCPGRRILKDLIQIIRKDRQQPQQQRKQNFSHYTNSNFNH